MNRIAFKYRANIGNKDDEVHRDTSTLLSHQLYAAPIDTLNDPFEASVELPIDNKNDNEWIKPLINLSHSVGVFSLIQADKKESFPGNELMWSHYADSHKGFCIEYDLDVLCQAISKSFDIISELNVNYQVNRPIISKTDEIDDVLQKIFGTKSSAWKYENEFRLVFGKYGLKTVPDEAIKAIYFGLHMPLKERQAITDGFKNDGIDFFQIERIENTYKLKATKLEFIFDYEIITEEHLPNIDNYIILHKSPNKDKSSINEFIARFRKNITNKANITIIDDPRVVEVFDKSEDSWTTIDKHFIENHWIGFSPFDKPDTVWIYPEKKQHGHL